ncbi:MAG: lysozyme family protein [Sporolactobacillus sp.]
MHKLLATICSMLAVLGFSYLTLFIISNLYSPAADRVPFLNSDRVISKKVEQLRPLFDKYARQCHLADKTNLLMAMAMQESKGEAVDIMQASESEGLPKDTIKNAKDSIRVGTHYFKRALQRAHGDIRLALQSYNFGLGFTDYVMARGGVYTPELARAFSQAKAKQLGWTTYGDPHYAEHVLRYYYNEQRKQAFIKNNQ